jgi:hypothetical protein
MSLTRIVLLTAVSLTTCLSVRGQSDYLDNRPRFLLDTAVGSETALGYEFPATSVGTSFELPIGNRFEVQGSGMYSPDKKYITNDGELSSVSGSALGFVNQRIGVVAGIERGWLWTSQFDKQALFPSAGIVLRNEYLGQGRLYITYTFPTGCVWATATNPCTIQSNRLQGVTIRQETRSLLHTRWGFETGVYHFCNQANPNDPEPSRNCRLGVSAMVTLSLEFHVGGKPRITTANAVAPDNF